MKRLAVFFVILAVLTALVAPAPVDAGGATRSGGGIARDFAGVSDKATFAGTGIGYATNDDWSVFAIVKLDTIQAQEVVTIGITGTGGWGARLGNTTAKMHWTWWTGDVTTTTTLTLNNTGWMALGWAADAGSQVTHWCIRYGTDTVAQEQIIAAGGPAAATISNYQIGVYYTGAAYSGFLDGQIYRVAIWRGAAGAGVITAAQFTALAFGQISPRDITTPTLVRDYVMTGAGSPDSIDGTTSDPLTFTGTTVVAGPSLRLPWSRVGASGAR